MRDQTVHNFVIAITAILLLTLAGYKTHHYQIEHAVVWGNALAWLVAVSISLGIEGMRGLLMYLGIEDYRRGQIKSAWFSWMISGILTIWDIYEAFIISVHWPNSSHMVLMIFISIIVFLLEIRVSVYIANRHNELEAMAEKKSRKASFAMAMAKNAPQLPSNMSEDMVLRSSIKRNRSTKRTSKPKTERQSISTKRRRAQKSLEKWEEELKFALESEDYKRADVCQEKIDMYKGKFEELDKIWQALQAS